MVEERRLKVISSFHGTNSRTGEYSFEVDDILELSVETKAENGRVLTWRVRAEGRTDALLSEAEVNLLRIECVIEFHA